MRPAWPTEGILRPRPRMQRTKRRENRRWQLPLIGTRIVCSSSDLTFSDECWTRMTRSSSVRFGTSPGPGKTDWAVPETCVFAVVAAEPCRTVRLGTGLLVGDPSRGSTLGADLAPTHSQMVHNLWCSRVTLWLFKHL